jgi:hypothetical protein
MLQEMMEVFPHTPMVGHHALTVAVPSTMFLTAPVS